MSIIVLMTAMFLGVWVGEVTPSSEDDTAVILKLQPGVSERPKFRNGSESNSKIEVAIQADPAPTSYNLTKDRVTVAEDTYQVEYVPGTIPSGTVNLTSLGMFQIGQYELVIENEYRDQLRYAFEIVHEDSCSFKPMLNIDGEKISNGSFTFQTVKNVKIKCAFEVCENPAILSLKCQWDDLQQSGNGKVEMIINLIIRTVHGRSCTCKSVEPEAILEAKVTFNFESEMRLKIFIENTTFLHYEKHNFATDIGVHGNPPPTMFSLTKDGLPVSGDAYVTTFTAKQFPEGDVTLWMMELSSSSTGYYNFTIENGLGVGLVFDFYLIVKKDIFRFRFTMDEIPSYVFMARLIISVAISADPPPFIYNVTSEGVEKAKDAYMVEFLTEAPPNGTVKLCFLTNVQNGLYQLVMKNRFGKQLNYKFRIKGREEPATDKGTSSAKLLSVIVLCGALALVLLAGYFGWNENKIEEQEMEIERQIPEGSEDIFDDFNFSDEDISASTQDISFESAESKVGPSSLYETEKFPDDEMMVSIEEEDAEDAEGEKPD